MIKPAAILFLSAVLSAGANFDQFLAALGKVESDNNPAAYNAKENAVGIYQIREKYFIDAQTFDPALRKYKHKDCFRADIAKKVVIAYLSKYCKEKNFESWARLHNSGPAWSKKKHLTDKYWLKIKAQLPPKTYV